MTDKCEMKKGVGVGKGSLACASRMRESNHISKKRSDWIGLSLVQVSASEAYRQSVSLFDFCGSTFSADGNYKKL